MPSTSVKNSKVILSKQIKMTKDYKEVTSLSESVLLSLLTANDHLVSYKENYSFIRERNSIKVNETYATCLQANYMAFQNPSYSNKWFFAFIDDVKYLSDTSTEIFYTVDVWSTWFDYWNPKTCFIVRQHATTDNIGDNLVPERIEHGEYTVVGVQPESLFATVCYLVVTTSLVEPATPTTHYVNMGGTIMNGFVYECDTLAQLDAIITSIDSQPDNKILYVYIVPRILIPDGSINVSTGLLTNWTQPYNNLKKVLDRPNNLDTYVPVNKKLLTYPYMYCLMTNGAGASNVLRFEDSGYLAGTTGLTAGSIYIRYWGVPSIGGSIVGIPCYYKNNPLSLVDELVLGKFPTLGWSEDAYTNWLSQNSVNNTVRKAITGAEIIGGIGSALIGGGLIASGVGAMVGVGMVTHGLTTAVQGGSHAIELASEYYNHSIEPDSYNGVINGGDVIAATGQLTFCYYSMTIKRDYAAIIDKFFTRFGYAQNAIQYPNLTHRANYNYIQISKDSTAAYVNNHNNINIPANDLETINNIFRAGVTVWNNHANMGDYSVANGITS